MKRGYRVSNQEPAQDHRENRRYATTEGIYDGEIAAAIGPEKKNGVQGLEEAGQGGQAPKGDRL